LAEGAPGSPSLSLYLEGIGGSFDREPNAQNTLQAVFPFNSPGQSGAARRYADAAATSGDVDRATLGVHVAREAGRAWIERAAWMERVEVRRRKLARIDEALALHEARYQLGEVAGTEVAQLDLEHVRETSALIDAEAESARRVGRLTELCGDGCALPLLDDLRSLVDATETPDPDELTVEMVEAGGLLRQAKAASAAAVARSELIGRTAFGRPSVALDWEHFPALDGLPSYDAWGFMIAVPVPVGRAGKQQRAAAAAEALASRERIEGRRRELLRMAVDARNDAEAAAERLATVTTVLSELERIEQSLVLQFRLGAISYLAYIDGLSRLDDVRLDAISIREALLLARLELATIVADPSIFPMPTVDEEAS
jgi:outer membrane protein TolC